MSEYCQIEGGQINLDYIVGYKGHELTLLTEQNIFLKIS